MGVWRQVRLVFGNILTRILEKGNVNSSTLRCQHLPFAVDLTVDRKFARDPLSIIPSRQTDPIRKPFFLFGFCFCVFSLFSRGFFQFVGWWGLALILAFWNAFQTKNAVAFNFVLGPISRIFNFEFFVERLALNFQISFVFFLILFICQPTTKRK